ncbi:MAG: response regulator transcription factor [Microbacteriaceae bacterium]|nr:response regulator transcription factor [Microbacteriaceae bacterium]
MPRHGLRAARPLGTLTEREQVILGHLESDLTRSEIAAELFVSENTLKAQLQSIFRKLGVRSRLEAVLVARENLPTTRADHPAT